MRFAILWQRDAWQRMFEQTNGLVSLQELGQKETFGITIKDNRNNTNTMWKGKHSCMPKNLLPRYPSHKTNIVVNKLNNFFVNIAGKNTIQFLNNSFFILM